MLREGAEVLQLEAGSKAGKEIKEDKILIEWARIPCHGFRNIAARLQLHPLARNRGDAQPTLALPEVAEQPVAGRLAGLSGNSAAVQGDPYRGKLIASPTVGYGF
jgi:hypothetical protein